MLHLFTPVELTLIVLLILATGIPIVIVGTIWRRQLRNGPPPPESPLFNGHDFDCATPSMTLRILWLATRRPALLWYNFKDPRHPVTVRGKLLLSSITGSAAARVAAPIFFIEIGAAMMLGSWVIPWVIRSHPVAQDVLHAFAFDDLFWLGVGFIIVFGAGFTILDAYFSDVLRRKGKAPE